MRPPLTSEHTAPTFIERAPPVAAQSTIHALWSFSNPLKGGDLLDHVVPADGCFSLVLKRHRTGQVTPIVLGPHDVARAVEVRADERYAGARFWPDSGGVCLGLNPVDWVGRAGAPPQRFAEMLTPVIDAVARDRPLKEWLDALGEWCARHMTLVEPDPVVRLAVLAIMQTRGRVAVTDLARLVRCGSRQLLRRFKAATGLTPKRYSRVRRFREAAMMHLRVPRLTWSHIAAEVGYADHAHLAREFQAITGEPPHLVARRVRRISHDVLSP